VPDGVIGPLSLVVASAGVVCLAVRIVEYCGMVLSDRVAVRKRSVGAGGALLTRSSPGSDLDLCACRQRIPIRCIFVVARMGFERMRVPTGAREDQCFPQNDRLRFSRDGSLLETPRRGRGGRERQT